MNLGKILGSISPAFGIASGKGLFGGPLLGQLGGMGLGGILGMLLSRGGGDEGGSAPQAPPQTLPGDTKSPVDMSAVYPGIDPVLTQGMGGQGAGGMDPRRFGRFGSDLYFGGRNPFGQNAIGKFLGGLF